MGIKEITLYKAVCDECGKVHWDDQESAEKARHVAVITGGWQVGPFLAVLCHECYEKSGTMPERIEELEGLLSEQRDVAFRWKDRAESLARQIQTADRRYSGYPDRSNELKQLNNTATQLLREWGE